MKRMCYYIIGLLFAYMNWGCSDDETIAREEIPVETDGGYLFAYMTNAEYGKLFYAVSRDGINWETLNKGRIINSDYIGHPDICQGHDGAFYMIAVDPLTLWRSEDLVTWMKRFLIAVMPKVSIQPTIGERLKCSMIKIAGNI